MLGAIPEMLQTSWGSLFKSLRLQKGERLRVCGGTTSVGLAAAAIAKNHGATVWSTTRRTDIVELLKANGADEVFIDNGFIAPKTEADGRSQQSARANRNDHAKELLAMRQRRRNRLHDWRGG